MENAGAAIESLMDTEKFQEALVRISWWYRQARGVKEPLTFEALDEVLMERAELYMCRMPEELKVPILVRQSDIEDGIPTDSEVETEVKGLKGDIAGAPLGMCVEDLKGWLREATRKKELVRERWALLVRLVQQTFGYRVPPEELAWNTMVFIPKGNGEYQGIGLVEVAYKVCVAVVNCRFK